MTFNNDLLTVIDDRVEAGFAKYTALGTMVDRPVGSSAQVIFDGSAIAIPVKVYANVPCRGGDRVGLIKFGRHWIVIGTFGRHGLRVFSLQANVPLTTTSFLTLDDIGESASGIEVAANTRYAFAAHVGGVGPVAQDLKIRWLFPSGDLDWGQINVTFTSAGGDANTDSTDFNWRRDTGGTSSALFIGGLGTAASGGTDWDNLSVHGGTLSVGNTGGFFTMQACQVVAGSASAILKGTQVQIVEL